MKKNLLFFVFFFNSLPLLISQTFNGTGGLIPDDYSVNVYNIVVNGLPNSLDTNSFGFEQVCINLTHTWNADLFVQLRAPDGTTILLFTSIGGDSDNFENTCFRQDASVPVILGWGPYAGTYRPMGDLGHMNNGQNPNGTWQLIIQDTYPGDSGELLDWHITFGNNPAKPFNIESSDLPIIKINTLGQNIPDEPKTPVLMQVIDNGPGLRNYVDQDTFAYEGTIGIEIRGSSSQSFPKKSYSFETWDNQNQEIDTTVLGLPRQSDWILSANYSDKSLMRNTLTYELSRRLGHYASRTKYCEMFINDAYQGIYILQEKVKRDSNRVDIAKLTASDTTGTELTGGYILKIDRVQGSGGGGWSSLFSQPNAPDVYTYFQFEYPSDLTILPQQANYIHSFVDSFEIALHGPDFQDPQTGWRKYAGEKSTMDYMFLNEMSKNVDGYRLSAFFYKEKATDGNKIKMGPAWDYDLGWLNADYCDAFNPSGWAYNLNYICGSGIPFWWERFMQDSLFRQNMACRWHQLRQTTLSEDSIYAFIDSIALVVDEAKDRNFYQWATLGVYVWPNPQPVPNTYAGEVEKLKNWIHDRFLWMDYQILSNGVNLDFSYNATPITTFEWKFDALNGSANEYHWDFDDGTTADGQHVTHLFPGLGTYQVTLTVVNNFGCENSGSHVIHISDSGTEDMTQTQINVFPNPFDDVLNIVASELPVQQISLCDVTGKEIASIQSNILQSNIAYHWNIQRIPAGYYLLKWKDREGRQSLYPIIKK